jgi:hypothetical protein
MEIKTKEERIKTEERRLRQLFKDMPKDTKTLYEGLIKRAAYMRITLEEYEEDIKKNGYVELFVQAKGVDPYDRERPVVRQYNIMNKNYQSIIKQINNALPAPIPEKAKDELDEFLSR